MPDNDSVCSDSQLCPLAARLTSGKHTDTSLAAMLLDIVSNLLLPRLMPLHLALRAANAAREHGSWTRVPTGRYTGPVYRALECQPSSLQAAPGQNEQCQSINKTPVKVLLALTVVPEKLKKKSSAVAEMGDRLDMGRKRGGLLCLFRGGGSWVPI